MFFERKICVKEGYFNENSFSWFPRKRLEVDPWIFRFFFLEDDQTYNFPRDKSYTWNGFVCQGKCEITFTEIDFNAPK